MTSKPRTARTAWNAASTSAIGTSETCRPVIAWITAWSPSAPASACAANQYVAATTRYGELRIRAPQKPSVARIATWPGSP